MPRHDGRAKTLAEKALLHARAIYDTPLRTDEVIDQYTYIFVPVVYGNNPNPPKIHVELVRSSQNSYDVEYVVVKRKLKKGSWQRAIIDVRPINMEGRMVDYYDAKRSYIEIYGPTEFINERELDFSSLSKWSR